jgi:hypothetical protein
MLRTFRRSATFLAFRRTHDEAAGGNYLCFLKIRSGRVRAVRQNQRMIAFDAWILGLLATFVADLSKSRRRLEAENLCFRHQLNIALRRRPSRLPLRGSDRALLVWMTRLWPSLLGMVQVVEPATILRWVQELLALEITKAGRATADCRANCVI